MAWLSRTNFVATDRLNHYDLNNLAMDIRNWGGPVNGGGYTLSNVVIPGAQTPWTQAINGAGFSLHSAGNIGVGTPSPLGQVHIKGNYSTIVFQDDQAPMTAGRLHRLTSTGAPGAWVWQINTAVGGDFSTIRSGIAFDQNGNVGIGTASPVVRFNVLANSTDPSLVADTAGIFFGYASSIGLAFGSYPSAPYSAWIQTKRTTNNGSADFLVINPLGGNVGIGATGAINRLTIADASRAYTDATAGFGSISISQTGAQTDDALLFGVHTGDYAWIQAIKAGSLTRNLLLNPHGGNVGIGTAGPSTKLQITADALPITSASVGLSQLSISGATDGNKNLWLAFDTSANVGVIQAGNVGASWNALVLNPVGGYVGIGMVAPNPSFRLEVNGHINIIGAGAAYHKNGVAVALGSGLTKRTVVTETRAFDTVYQNAGEQSLAIAVVIAFAALEEDRAEAYTDETETPMTLVGSTVGPVTLMFYVLPGHYYRVTSTDPTAAISSWVEWE